MAEFQELVISLWASVGWNLNGRNVPVICNTFQLSAQHTWGNERDRVHSRKHANIKYIIDAYTITYIHIFKYKKDEDTLRVICNMF